MPKNILFVGSFALMLIPFASAAAPTGPFELGGQYNPINITVTRTQNQINAQSESNLQTAYGIAAYNSCRSACSGISDLANPNQYARCLVYIDACLQRINRYPVQQPTSNVTNSVQQSPPVGIAHTGNEDLDTIIAQQNRVSSQSKNDELCEWLQGEGYIMNEQGSCVLAPPSQAQNQTWFAASSGGGGGGEVSDVLAPQANKSSASNAPASKFYIDQHPNAGNVVVVPPVATVGPTKVQERRTGLWSWVLSLFGL